MTDLVWTQSFFARLHEALVAVAAVRLKGLKNRAVRHLAYRMADGHASYGFVHLNILIREGRQATMRQAMAVLEKNFGHLFD